METTRRPLLVLALAALLCLMAGALWLALDGASPADLLRSPEGAELLADGAAGGPGGSDADAADRASRRGRRPGHIAGDVRDLRSRAPAAGRIVTLTLSDGDIRQVSTDAAGGFAFGEVPPDRPHLLRVDGDDHAPVVRAGLFLRPGERLDVGTLWLADGVRVAVEVRSFDGRALAGATVRAYTQGPGSARFDTPRDPTPVALVHTDADGVGRFVGLPPGTWTFTAERGGYARRGLVGVTVRQGVREERFRLALESGHRLDGRVLDALGQPVAGAPVLAIRRTLVSDETTAPLALRTTTDREGRFVFAALPAADVVLWSGWPGGRLAVLAAVRLPGVATLDLVLLRGGRLTGVVTRADDGPVEDADVNVSLQVLGSFVLSFQVQTDRDGRYVLDLPMPGTVTGISAEKRGCRTEWAELGDGIAVPTGALVAFDLVLQRGGVITGRVTGPDGPLANVEVAATNSGWYFSAGSDREGRFVLNGLPQERFLVMASLWGHVMPDLPESPDDALARGTAPARYVADLSVADTAEVDIQLLPGALLTGRVQTHDGAPASGAVVATPSAGVATYAAEDGSFELGPLERGELQIVATSSGGGARGSVTVHVPPAPEAPEPVTIRLGPELHVRGVVTSSTGRPLEGAYVQIVPWDGGAVDPVADEWSWLQETRLPVDASGTFDHVVDGSVTSFVVRAGALGHRRAHSGHVSVAPGQPEAYVELELTTGETFTGRVVDLDGAPVPGAHVAAVAVPPGTAADGVDYPGAWGPPIVAVADAHGELRVEGLDAGPHAVRVWAAGYLPDARVVDVPEDSGATFEIVAALSIEGRVAFADGEPVIRARVTAMNEDGGDFGEGRTDEDGRFLVPGLSVGSYRLEVRAAADRRQNMVPATLDGVAAGTPDVHVTVERGRRVTGRVVDASGDAVADAQVQALDGDDALAQDVSDGSGAFALEGLPAGRITLSVQCDALQGIGAAVLTLNAGATDVDVALPVPAVVAGVLVGPDGAPIAGHELQLDPRESATAAGVAPWWRSVSTGADGSFELLVAPGASYHVALGEHPSLTLPPNTVLSAGEMGARLVAGTGESISGRLVGPDGAGVADVEVRASFDEGSRAATSRADGSFTITGLHAGTSYSLWVSSARWQVRASPVVAAPATGVTVPVTGRLFMGGRVVDTDGQPLRGAIVRVPSGDGSWWSTSTDEDGSFYLGDVPDGEYAVHVDRHGDGNAVECGTLRAGVIGAEIRYPGR